MLNTIKFILKQEKIKRLFMVMLIANIKPKLQKYFTKL